MVWHPGCWFLPTLRLLFFVSSYKMFACHSAHNNPEPISETSGMMPNFACVEQFFAHKTFKAAGAAGHSCRTQFSTRQILNAKAPEPGGGSTVEAEGIPRHYLDATTGDIQSNQDWRASLSARLRP